MSSGQHYSELLTSMERQGCGLRRTTKGWQVKFPDGGMLVFHLTPSEYRAERNIRAIVRRHRMEWPFDK